MSGTIDDSVGEALDKAARMLGISGNKSGGALLEAEAEFGNYLKYPFVIPMISKKVGDLSYAGEFRYLVNPF